MAVIPFVTLDDPRYGEAVQVAPLVRRVIANNPSKFTYHGTGTYIVGGSGRGDAIAIIDPGPADDAHRDALAAAIAGQTITAILVTHCHADHSPLAAWLRAATGAPTVAFGPHGRDERDIGEIPELDDVEPAVAPAGPDVADASRGEAGEVGVKIEESVDLEFDPDVRVADGDVAAQADGWTLRAVFTPGHTSNHMCFSLDEHRALFTGDHIMGWSTTVIGPPDGDMRAYLESLHKVRGRSDSIFWPTHGSPVTDTRPFIDAFLAHRLDREAQVLAAVRGGVVDIAPMVRRLYAGVAKELHKPAARSVLAHLVKLVEDGVVTVEDGGPPRLDSRYRTV
jgi:glyoxylase-like metal-dependent hydrolase (beta-lactamase superfamily II)